VADKMKKEAYLSAMPPRSGFTTMPTSGIRKKMKPIPSIHQKIIHLFYSVFFIHRLSILLDYNRAKYTVVKLWNDLTRGEGTNDLFLKIFGAFLTSKVQWISSTYNERLNVFLAPQ
jgi:hypothetical protein